jgi:MerR family copper efflux transcriptional regulator
MNLTIGKIARQAALGIETVRFYEKQGLLLEPQRSSSNYRLYPEEEVARLRFIKRAKELGFSLREVRELLQLHDDPQATKGEVRERTEAKIADIRKKIADLSRMLAALETLVAACDGHGPVMECPILQALEGPEDFDTKHNHGGGQ